MRIPFHQMFERFTGRARQVVVLAQEEARQFGHDWIGTEHLLLGVIREGEGVGARALESLGITVEGAREQVVQIVGRCKEPASSQFPFTPRAKKVLELGSREAVSLGDGPIASHHLLLGLLREGEGVANRIMLDSGAEAEHLRGLVLAGLPGAPEEQAPAETGTLTRLIVHGRPGEDPAASPIGNLSAAVCSFCRQKGPHLFGSHSAATDVWICGECLDQFCATLSHEREGGSPHGPGANG